MFDEKMKRKMDYIGVICRPKVRMFNRMGGIGPKTYVLVTSSSKGVSLVSRPCDCCDMNIRMNQVNTDDLEPVLRLYTPHNRWSTVPHHIVKRAWEKLDEYLATQESDPEARVVEDVV